MYCYDDILQSQKFHSDILTTPIGNVLNRIHTPSLKFRYIYAVEILLVASAMEHLDQQ